MMSALSQVGAGDETSSSSPAFQSRSGNLIDSVHGFDQAGELAHVGVHPALQRGGVDLRGQHHFADQGIPALAISERPGSRYDFGQVVTEVFLQEAGKSLSA